MAKNPLVGKTIAQMFLADDQGAIRFVLSDGSEIKARCDGDCCSHTWIEDVINPKAAIGSEVLSVDDLDLPEEFRLATKTEHYEEEMAYYAFVIDTAKGRCTLAYRNSSNGYYGGSLSWDGDYHYGGVHAQNNSSEVWRAVAESAADAERAVTPAASEAPK
jgi:hypothetical protein